MAKSKGGDQTEKPTAKRLRDARKEGEVSKSKELGSTVLVLFWLLMAWIITPIAAQQLSGLFELSLQAVSHVGREPLPALWQPALRTLLLVCLPPMCAAAAVGTLAEFLQVGGMFVPKRVAPKMDRLNPVENVGKMFSQESLIELVKSVFKTAALVAIFILVLLRMLPEVLRLPLGLPGDLGRAHWRVMMWVGVWAVFVFSFLSALDLAYQRFAFTKNLRMSRRDIRQEVKDSEGDPMVKSRRKQLHQEWAQQNMLEAVRKSSAVVVNPEHIAVAIRYEQGQTELPVVTAKGEDYEAQLIREAAEKAGVPVMRNVELARGLHEKVNLEEYISSDFFEAVAELLRWAETLRLERLGLAPAGSASAREYGRAEPPLGTP
jgi:type III secretion protein U